MNKSDPYQVTILFTILNTYQLEFQHFDTQCVRSILSDKAFHILLHIVKWKSQMLKVNLYKLLKTE